MHWCTLFHAMAKHEVWICGLHSFIIGVYCNIDDDYDEFWCSKCVQGRKGDSNVIGKKANAHHIELWS